MNIHETMHNLAQGAINITTMTLREHHPKTAADPGCQ
jgi:hypothetical protein